MLKYFRGLLLRTILALLEIGFAIARKKTIAPFPYDRNTKKIALPAKEKKKLRRLVLSGKKPAAIKRVAQLTGANLRISKDYVDAL